MNRRIVTAPSLASMILTGLLASAQAGAAVGPDLAAAASNALAVGATAQSQQPRTTSNRNPRDSTGELTFEFPVHDFGLQPDGQELTITFPFKNTGDETIKIVNTRTSCGCTAAVLDEEEFAPGEGSMIDVTYKPAGNGRQTKTITVQTNSISNPTHRLRVTADVVQVIDVEPSVLQFGNVLVGNDKSTYVDVFSKDPNMTIKDVQVNGSAPLVAEVLEEAPEVVKSGFPGKKRIKVTAPDSLSIGRVHGKLRITAMAAFQQGENPDVQTEHTKRVSILGRVVGNLKASPSAIRMLPLQPNEEFSYTTRITHRDGDDFDIDRSDIKLLRSSIPGVQATLEPFEEGPRKGYIVTIKGDAGNHRGAFRGTFAITPDIAGEPPLRINFSGTVRTRR